MRVCIGCFFFVFCASSLCAPGLCQAVHLVLSYCAPGLVKLCLLLYCFLMQAFIYAGIHILLCIRLPSSQVQQAVQRLMVLKSELGAAEATLRAAQGVPLTEQGTIDYAADFFGRPTYLTVSGQLNGEMYATALGDVYTFGADCLAVVTACRLVFLTACSAACVA